MTWLLYGAYGYTGRLLVEEAVGRGHKPVLGGRDAAKTAVIARQYNLEHVAFDLADNDKVRGVVADFDLVFHAAGPFIHTAEPMVQACLAGSTHYLDITGEIPVFEMTLSYDAHAREQGVALISGAGFDIVPTDCLASYVAANLPDATELEIAFWGLSGASAGTAKSMLEMMTNLPQGSLVRRNGRLVSIPLGQGARQITFSNGKVRDALPIPWGDLATAQQATGIPNVTTYMALRLPRGAGWLTPTAARALQFSPLRRLAKKVVDWTVRGPSEQVRQTARSYIWACARDRNGGQKEAWLQTMEAYRLTAVAGIRAVEHTLTQSPAGALTPSLAFGADFVLELPDTHRYDSLPAAESSFREGSDRLSA
jgi:short subunit dehydrogenase-like uncharacterized protein